MFSQTELAKGEAFLKKTGFLQMFIDFGIPEFWKTEGSVPCLDLFCMERVSSISLSYDDYKLGPIEDEDCDDDLKSDLIKISGATTCYSAAKYIYELLVYIQLKYQGTDTDGETDARELDDLQSG